MSVTKLHGVTRNPWDTTRTTGGSSAGSAAAGFAARLVGIFPLDHEVSVGEYQRLAHAAVDEVIDTGRTPVAVGGTGLYFRAALSSLQLPPPPAPGSAATVEVPSRL